MVDSALCVNVGPVQVDRIRRNQGLEINFSRCHHQFTLKIRRGIASTTYLNGVYVFFKNMSECYFKERYSLNNAYLAEVCCQMISIESENNDRNV